MGGMDGDGIGVCRLLVWHRSHRHIHSAPWNLGYCLSLFLCLDPTLVGETETNWSRLRDCRDCELELVLSSKYDASSGVASGVVVTK